MHLLVRRALAALLPTVSLALLTAGPAFASVDVTLRIEGKDRTIFEGRVNTDGHNVQGHRCDGTNGGASKHAGPTVTSALDDGARDNHFTWGGKWSRDFQDFFVERIANDSQDEGDNEYWGYLRNYKEGQVGGCQQLVDSGDEVLWAYDEFGKTPLKLSAPDSAGLGESFTVHVEDGSNGHSVSGARVAGQETNGNGDVSLRYDSARRIHLKATKSGAIRSNEESVCVHGSDGQCSDEGSADVVAPATATALTAQISGLVALHRYPASLAPRVLSGTVSSAGVPLTSMRIRLRRYYAGHCSHYSLVQRRFQPSRCTVSYFYYSLAPTTPWSYTLPARLPVGTYTLEASALDATGRRAVARRVFYVVAPARR